MNDRYTWRGGSEMLLRHGEGAATTLLVLPALFEEANRMRRFTVSIMRELATQNIGTILPDLPGTGESLLPLSRVTFDDWRDAVATLAASMPRPLLSIAIRGGSLFDGISDFGWRLAPENGDRIVRDLVRATALSENVSATEIDRRARAQPTRLAGNPVTPELYRSFVLATNTEANRRTIRLEGDAGPRDCSITGRRLWRAAEPGDDPNLVSAAVKDIVVWTNRCDA